MSDENVAPAPDSSEATSFPTIIELVSSGVRLSRRALLERSALGVAAFVAGRSLLAVSAGASVPGAVPWGADPAAGGPGLLGFESIPPGSGDEVRVPAGYTARPFIPWGTPILGALPAFVPGTAPFVAGGNSAAEQAEQVGMHHDGMHYFPGPGIGSDGRGGSRRGLLVVNHEYTDEGYLHTGSHQPAAWLTAQKPSWTSEMVRKSQHAHGVSIIEIRRTEEDTAGPPGAGAAGWEVVRSRYNRRITANTEMRFSGPATGHRLLRTSADPEGRTPVGTFNNCANGSTPWGTYLTCEENFNGYFRLDSGDYDPESAALTARYVVGGDKSNWATTGSRFVVTPAEVHEPNRFGWVVEIDPTDPQSTPVKRTALGRMKHEGAFVHVTRGRRLVVYMGDDQANEHIYKFVSAGNWTSLRGRRQSPLDRGVLYVARFEDDGTGRWLPLVYGTGPLVAANGFADQGDVLVKTRLAATAVGATPMDRPEWITVDPRTGSVLCSLTNNTAPDKVEGPANPRKPNPWGHVIRWEERGRDHSAMTFSWDLFVVAGDAFGSPDGLWADPDGRIWIQTDGTQPGGANDQMLAADPQVTDAKGVPEIRRFLTGVQNGEVTGVTATPDQRTMFVNIQHPGEGGSSTWPHLGGLTTPRAATVVITKDDGGVIGT